MERQYRHHHVALGFAALLQEVPQRGHDVRRTRHGTCQGLRGRHQLPLLQIRQRHEPPPGGFDVQTLRLYHGAAGPGHVPLHRGAQLGGLLRGVGPAGLVPQELLARAREPDGHPQMGFGALHQLGVGLPDETGLPRAGDSHCPQDGRGQRD